MINWLVVGEREREKERKRERESKITILVTQNMMVFRGSILQETFRL